MLEPSAAESSTREGQLMRQDPIQRLHTAHAGPSWHMAAWTTELTFSSLKLPTPEARMPCLALRCDKSGQCSASTFKGVERGVEAAIKPGSHSFVRLPGEDFIRASKCAFPFGKASGHGMLSNEQQVLFAGEIEINEDGYLTCWNNISGTYKFPARYALQAELPLDAFWELVKLAEVPIQAQNLTDWRDLSGGLWLHKCGFAGIKMPCRMF